MRGRKFLTCQSRKSDNLDTPEVLIKMSTGGEAEVYKFEAIVSSVISLQRFGSSQG